MEYDLRFKKLSLNERADIMRDIEGALESLNMTNYPLIRTYLSDSDGRIALLQKIINMKFESAELSLADIIDNIENTQD